MAGMTQAGALEAGEEAPPGAKGARRRRFGLKPQLLLLLFVLNLVSAIAYSVMLYELDRREIIDGIDARLHAGVNAVREIVPDGYHEQITGPASVPPAQFDALQQRLSRFAADSRFVYVYSYMRFGRQIRTVATSATPREMAEGRQTHFFALYDTAPRHLFDSFADGRVRFDEYHDSFGRFRSIYKPVRAGDGRVVVLGADIDLGWLDARLHAAMVHSAAIGVMMFALSMALGWLLIARIVAPLVTLTQFTRNMEARRFEPDEAEMRAMRRIGGTRGDEVGSLAEAMAAMIARLQRYLVEMEAATAARERVEGELSAARDIQVGMLPRRFPPFPERRELDIHALLEPAREVGGDLYDYVLVDEHRLFFVVGDVSGKGVPAALFMAMATTLFRASALSGAPVAAIMARVNAELARDNAAEMFVTAFAGVLDLRSGRVEYCDGGHEAPFIVRADGRVERLAKRQGLALGVFEDVPFAPATFDLRAGDALVLFTDGVSEATDSRDEIFTVARIQAALAEARRDADARCLAEGLAGSVRVFAGPVAQSDDIAILVVGYEGPSGAGAASTGETPVSPLPSAG